MSYKKEHRQETLIYLALWAITFIAPVLSLMVRASNSGNDFEWHELLIVWRQFAVFFVVFLIHNHWMAPMLVYEQKWYRYLSLVVAITAIFIVYQCNHRPRHDRMDPMGGPPPEMRADEPRPSLGQSQSQEPPFIKPLPEPREPEFRHRGDGHRRNFAPLFFGQHDIVSLIILLLMMGGNLGIKLYFKQRNDQRKLAELERENLEQQLEYLKYQINPHFFMNTLNNIHALVDIDPEKAKHTILELSKMMRFVLYEGNKPKVPLDREVAFLQNYITLMKLRYTDKVRITVDVDNRLPSCEVPPLMFITFVENAFKHGVSYRQESFIVVGLKVDGMSGEDAQSQLIFTCENSKLPHGEDKHGGVGLRNVRQRLDLIYGDRYTLDISDQTDTYTVKLSIPL